MKTLHVRLVAALLLACTSTLFAQSSRGTVGLGVLMGGSILNGDIGNSNTGVAGGLFLRLTPIQPFALQARATYSQMATGFNSINTGLFNASLVGTLFLLPSSRLTPFVNFGLAAFHFDVTDDNNNTFLHADGSPFSGWDRAVQVGFGFEFFVADDWALNATGDYFLTKGDDLDGVNAGTNDNFFNGLIGFVHYFHKRKAKDTGVEFTSVSESAVESSELEEADLADSLAAILELSAPEEKVETRPAIATSGARKEVGDSDALKALNDFKKTFPVDDEISSEKEAETSTVPESTQQTASVRKPQEQQEEVPNGVYFEPGTAKILKKSKDYLELIYTYLTDNPEEEIELKDFEESNTDEVVDKQLALERAIAVKVYLVNLGIQPDRIIIVGNKAE
ncbi:MAG: OmpA family protein [bacterium]